MKTKSLAAILLLIPLLFVTSCKKEVYRNDVACRSLTSTIEEICQKEFISYDDEYLEYIISDASICTDHSIIYSRDTNDIDEFGVLHAKDNDTAKKLYTELCDYISETRSSQRAFIESYAPKELTKLDSARVIQIGNYVIYSIASEESAKKISSAITSALTE